MIRSNFAAILLIACMLALCAIASHGATPQPVQICTVTPAASGGLMGCPTTAVVFAVPKNPTDRLRSQVGGYQQWLPYSAVTANTTLYGGTPAMWQSPAALGLALLPAAPVIPPVVPPAATQTVIISSVDNPQFAITYQGAAVPACFNINTKQICVP